MKNKKTSSKLQNNKAIRQMLDGTHRTQTRKTISRYVGKQNQKRDVGERWTDDNGVVWEQRKGYRVQGADRAERMEDLNSYLTGVSNCPECNVEMSNRNDKKYYNIHKMCMECSVQKETEMRANGTWKEYERQKLIANVSAWLRDAEVEKEVLKRQLSNNSYVNGDGTLEKWELPYDVDEQCKRIENGFVKFKKNLLTKYNATEKELELFGIANGDDNVKENKD